MSSLQIHPGRPAILGILSHHRRVIVHFSTSSAPGTDGFRKGHNLSDPWRHLQPTLFAFPFILAFHEPDQIHADEIWREGLSFPRRTLALRNSFQSLRPSGTLLLAAGWVGGKTRRLSSNLLLTPSVRTEYPSLCCVALSCNSIGRV